MLILTITLIATILACLAIQAFFAASEMALISLDYIKIRSRADQGNRQARAVAFFLEHPRLLFGTTLLGVNIAVVLNSACTSYLAGRLLQTSGIVLQPQVQNLLTTAAVLPLVLFFGEIVPMGFARLYPEWFTRSGITLFKVLYLLLLPFVRITSFISSLVCILLRTDAAFHASLLTREELESYISNSFAASDTLSGTLSIETIISDTFLFSKTTAVKIMIPLINIKALPDTAVTRDVWNIAAKHAYSRIPVYSARIDNIRGYIYAADFLREAEDCPVTRHMKSPLIIPETVTLSKVLPQMISQGEHVAFLVNEFGGITGMISDEDAVEEVFGHIYDEHDDRQSPRGRTGEIAVNADMEISELNAAYGLSIPESDEYETLAGFLLYSLKRIPEAGTLVKIEKLEFRIVAATDRRITRITINREKEGTVRPAGGTGTRPPG